MEESQTRRRPRPHLWAVSVAVAATAVTAAVLATGGGAAPGGAFAACNSHGMKVAIVMHFQAPFTQEEIDGAKAAAAECKAKLSTAGPQGIDPPTHVKIFRDVVSTKPKAILVTAYPADLWVKPINDAVAKGITISTTDVASPKSKQLVHTGPKDSDLGRSLANAFVAKSGPSASGVIVVGNCIPGLDVLDNRVNAFIETIKAKLPNVTIKGPFDVTVDPGKNFNVWQSLVTANKDAIGFIGVCEFDGPSLEKVIQPISGAKGKYIVGSIGINPDSLQGITDGYISFVVGQNPFMMGYVGMRAMLAKIVQHQVVPRGWINTSEETVTLQNVAKITARENSLKSSTKGTRAYYAPQINRIFGNLKRSVQPFARYLSH